VNGSTTCRAWDASLRGDQDARITPELASALRAHLRVCAECRTRHAADLDLIEALAQVPVATPPAWRAPRPSWRRAAPIAAAAVVLILVRLGAPALTPRATPNPDPKPRSMAAGISSGTPVAAVFQQVERRFQLGCDQVEAYVIITTYHSFISFKP
jgi:hypothetical protein